MPAVFRLARRPVALLLALSACITLSSCGGGGGDGGSTEPPPPGPPPSGPPGGLDSRPSNTTCIATPEPGFAVSVKSTRVFPNLTFQMPVLMLQAPGDDSAWYVVQQDGLVLTFANSDSVASASTFVDLRDRVVALGEGGLLGMAFDPNYATSNRVYLSYTANPTVSGSVLESRISRFESAGGVLNPASESILLTLAQPFTNHNGGNIAFGPDNFLYAGFGDGGGGGDPDNRSQNRSVLFGKMLRIDVSGGGAYTVPPDNPFAGGARCDAGQTTSGAICPEIYAYGLRNPWRWSFDKASPTPDLWVGDVGQGAWEEIDRVQAGGNYGWRVREGAHCFNPSANCTSSADGSTLIDPVAEYSHALGSSITGGYVYRGSAIPSLVGRYVFGDFGSGNVFALMPGPNGTMQVQQILSTGALITSFAQGSDGELYYVDFGTGSLHKIVPDAAPANPVKTLLSQTGCMNPADPTLPAAGLIPYTPIAQFWSDGAIKSRWMALPDNTRITVEADGDWTFPTGTVLVKNFTLNGQLIETRLFMRHVDSGNWGGYTYRWNSDHTDATLVSGGLTETIGAQEWTYPSEAQCLQCHTSGAGRTLGLETRQLNSSITYPTTGRTANQIATLRNIGLFANAPADEDPYPDPSDAGQSTGNRARAYLHTNCAQCHRPGGGTPVNLDLRYATAMGDTNACDVAPASGDLGVADARIIAPGNASKSLLFLRMNTRDANQMPPLASHVIDEQGVALVEQWISGMDSTCQALNAPSR